MNIQQSMKKLVRKALNSVGFDVVRSTNNPAVTLLGLIKLPIHTVIDVGANTGQFARKIKEFYPDASIYCFEPLPGPFKTLNEWTETQKGKVKAFNMAVGDKQDEVEMFLHEDHTPSSSLLATTKYSEDYYPFVKEQKRVCVEQTTLDDVLRDIQCELSPEILIKLDVQGYEDRVVRGGSDLFRQASACILEVCLDNLYEGQAGFRQLVSMLDDLDFRYVGNLDQSYGEDGHCIFLDAVFLRRT